MHHAGATALSELLQFPVGGELRKEKEKAIRKSFSTRMELALQRLQKTIAAGSCKCRHGLDLSVANYKLG
jgi:hypothetical protein